MLERFQLDSKVIEFANKVSDTLQLYETNKITAADFAKALNEKSDFKNKPITLGFLFTHVTFYKSDLKTPWTLPELLTIIKANPNMLNIQ
jgi:hypothetical protein